MATKSISYNSYNLQTSSVVMTNLEFQTIGKDLSITRLSTTDINKFIESYVSNKVIVYTGYIKGTSDSHAETQLDILKQNIMLNGVANLDIGYASGTRRYRAVTQSVEVTGETPALDVKEITITFATVEPLGFDTTSQTISYLGETASPTKTITFSGTYYPLPTYTVTVSAENALTGISIKSVETNQEIIVQQNYNAGDVLIVNTRDKVVTYNGTSVDYFGIFPLAQQGTNNITFSSTSTSHNLNISINYTPRYL